MPPSTKFSSQAGRFEFAEALFDSHRYSIRCTQCESDLVQPGFIRDQGGKVTSDGRRRRLWKCQRSNSNKTTVKCRRVTCRDYVELASVQLARTDFLEVLDDLIARPDHVAFEDGLALHQLRRKYSGPPGTKRGPADTTATTDPSKDSSVPLPLRLPLSDISPSSLQAATVTPQSTALVKATPVTLVDLQPPSPSSDHSSGVGFASRISPSHPKRPRARSESPESPESISLYKKPKTYTTTNPESVTGDLPYRLTTTEDGVDLPPREKVPVPKKDRITLEDAMRYVRKMEAIRNPRTLGPLEPRQNEHQACQSASSSAEAVEACRSAASSTQVVEAVEACRSASSSAEAIEACQSTLSSTQVVEAVEACRSASSSAEAVEACQSTLPLRGKVATLEGRSEVCESTVDRAETLAREFGLARTKETRAAIRNLTRKYNVYKEFQRILSKIQAKQSEEQKPAGQKT